MAWIDEETSNYGGRPVELFAFVGPTSSLEYYYTSHHDDVSFGGDTYTSVHGLSRDSVSIKQLQNAQGLQLELPVSLDVVQDYAFGIPPDTLNLTIYRLHGAASLQWWQGKVRGFHVSGLTARCTSVHTIDSALGGDSPNIWYATQCQHRLYDDRCGVVDTDHDAVTTVSSISADTYTVTLAGDGGFADQEARGGYLLRATDGARRLVVDHVGNVVILAQPFRTLSAADSVTLFRGCAHNAAVCRDTFNNILNFGGFPFISGHNIFRSRWGVKGIS